MPSVDPVMPMTAMIVILPRPATGANRGSDDADVARHEHLATRRTLLVLDTNEGSDAERLYARLGWQRVGSIPDFSIQPRGGLRATVVYYKRL